MPVDVPPLAVQDLVEVGGIEAVDAQAPGQSGINVGVGVHQPRHDDAAPGVQKRRLRVPPAQLLCRTHGGNFRAVDHHTAVGEIGERAVAGDEPAISQNVHAVFLLFFLSAPAPGKEKMFQTGGFETLKQRLSDSCSPCAQHFVTATTIFDSGFIIPNGPEDCNGNICNIPPPARQKTGGSFVRFDEHRRP